MFFRFCVWIALRSWWVGMRMHANLARALPGPLWLLRHREGLRWCVRFEIQTLLSLKTVVTLDCFFALSRGFTTMPDRWWLYGPGATGSIAWQYYRCFSVAIF